MERKPKVFAAKRLPPEAAAYLERYCEVRTWDGEGTIPRERLLSELTEAEGFLTSGDAVDEELLARAPKLRAVSTVSVGYNHFDLEAMRRPAWSGRIRRTCSTTRSRTWSWRSCCPPRAA